MSSMLPFPVAPGQAPATQNPAQAPAPANLPAGFPPFAGAGAAAPVPQVNPNMPPPPVAMSPGFPGATPAAPSAPSAPGAPAGFGTPNVGNPPATAVPISTLADDFFAAAYSAVDNNSTAADAPKPIYPGEYLVRVTLLPEAKRKFTADRNGNQWPGSYKVSQPDKSGNVQRIGSMGLALEIVAGRHNGQPVNSEYVGRKWQEWINTYVGRTNSSTAHDFLRAMTGQKGQAQLQSAPQLLKAIYDMVGAAGENGVTVAVEIDWQLREYVSKEDREATGKEGTTYLYHSRSWPSVVNGVKQPIEHWQVNGQYVSANTQHTVARWIPAGQ